MAEILLHYIMRIFDRENQVLEFHHLHKIMESLTGFSLELFDQPEPLGPVLAEYRDSLKYGVETDKVAKPYIPHLSHVFLDAWNIDSHIGLDLYEKLRFIKCVVYIL